MRATEPQPGSAAVPALPHPLVGVVVPTIGRWDLLDGALTAIESQRDVQTQIVLVNDSGEPVPEAIANRCIVTSTDNRSGEGRAGEGRARAAGLEMITTEWVAFCDDDDVWHPHKLKRQLEAMGGRGGWCVCGAELVDADLRPVGRRSADRVRGLVESGDLLRDLLSHNPIPAGSSTVLVSTDLLRSVGGWDIDLAFFADWECWIRLAAASDPVVVCEDLALYRQWGGQMIADRSKAWEALDHIRRRHHRLRRQRGVSPLDDRVIAWILAGELATPGRRLVGAKEAARRLQPRRWRDLAAVGRGIRLVIRQLRSRTGV